eukprot:3312025-Rhodomonas_salina.2
MVPSGCSNCILVAHSIIPLGATPPSQYWALDSVIAQHAGSKIAESTAFEVSSCGLPPTRPAHRQRDRDRVRDRVRDRDRDRDRDTKTQTRTQTCHHNEPRNQMPAKPTISGRRVLEMVVSRVFDFAPRSRSL